jgi:hypothetical protein
LPFADWKVLDAVYGVIANVEAGMVDYSSLLSAPGIGEGDTAAI